MSTPNTNKPQKPSPDYPLYAHASGKWAKKIAGRVHYFGKWDDPVAALKAYRQFTKRPETRCPDVLSLGDACNHFLENKDAAIERGELSKQSFTEYKLTCARLLAFWGREKPVKHIGPTEFRAYRDKRSETLGLVALGNEITRVKTLFRWLEANDWIEAPSYGPDFKKPSAKAVRRERREKGKKLLTQSQVSRLIAEAGSQMRAIVLLGINGALGPTDCARLPLRASQTAIETGWLDYPRPKTEVDRLIPLWPETVEALRDAIKRRYPPSPDAQSLTFVKPSGEGWEGDMCYMQKRFNQLRKNAGVDVGSVYWLRHTFCTVALGSKDPEAVKAIMGHIDPSVTATYKHEIGRDRLVAVTDYVRSWLLN